LRLQGVSLAAAAVHAAASPGNDLTGPDQLQKIFFVSGEKTLDTSDAACTLHNGPSRFFLFTQVMVASDPGAVVAWLM
jgi:hypothetical protein